MNRAILVALLGMIVAGCQPDRPSLPRVDPSNPASVRDYLNRLPRGTPLTAIERDLALQPSTDCEAPTLQPYRPHWDVHYAQHGLHISFEAEDLSPQGDGSLLVYASHPDVLTHAEFVQLLRDMGVP